MSLQRACCCACQVGDCIISDTVDSGCCHACDELLLWCERPGYSQTQQVKAAGIGPGSPTCQWHFRIDVAAQPPVQAIYKYHRNFWRCNIPLAGIPSLLPPVPRCIDPHCSPLQDCCNESFPTNCDCGTSWMSPYRREQWMLDPAARWGVETQCFKGGSALSGTVGSLGDTFLCVVHRERWWRIPNKTCNPEDYLYIPNCATDECVGPCGTVPYQRDDIVPKWWIYACSGVPFFTWELEDAVTRGHITATEQTTFLNRIALGQQPPQDILDKIAEGGYFDVGDWRDEQRQAFIDLNTRFAGAGYAGCIQAVTAMAELGPVRKRLCAPFASAAVVPWLNRDDATASQQALNVSAGCFIDYPGSLSVQADYDYWADRQWVYFRAIPGGWVWAGWNAVDDPACTAQGFSEEEAILNGCGRADQSCIGGLKGEPRPAPCCTDLTPICPDESIVDCSGCGDPESCPCGAMPVVGCGPFSPSPVATDCLNLVISPFCEGVRFAYAVYVNELKLTVSGEDCVQTNDYRCMYVAKSYLVEAKRSSDSWSDSIPFQCRTESPVLPVFNAWPPISRGHYGIQPICDSIVTMSGEYTVTDLCCSGHCWDYYYVGDPPQPCLDPTGQSNPCPSTTDCPPHSTLGQISCIGYDPDCTP